MKKTLASRAMLVITSLTMLLVSRTVLALNADDVRGGWETYTGGIEHVYEFKIRGSQVTGIYCTLCSDAETLAFVNGTWAQDGITFTVTHVRDDGSTDYQESAHATFANGQLTVKGGRLDGSGAFEWIMRKDPRGPVPAPFGTMVQSKLPLGPYPGSKMETHPFPEGELAGGRYDFVVSSFPGHPPGPWERLSMARVAGVWVIGPGVNKQYFIMRKVGDKLLGMACGPCSNPYSMTFLENFQIHGDTMEFDSDHEDWGLGTLPNVLHATARVVDNEMWVYFVQDDIPNEQPNIPNVIRITSVVLVGPIPLDATRPFEATDK